MLARCFGQRRAECCKLGRHRGDEARQALDRLCKRQGCLTMRYIDATYPFRRPGDRAMLLEGLRKAGWRSDP